MDEQVADQSFDIAQDFRQPALLLYSMNAIEFIGHFLRIQRPTAKRFFDGKRVLIDPIHLIRHTRKNDSKQAFTWDNYFLGFKKSIPGQNSKSQFNWLIVVEIELH